MSSPLDGVELVDHHCHGVLSEPLTRQEFESLLTEADAPGPGHGSLFDTQVGFGVRRWCAPLLELPVHAEPDAYLARRAELGADELTRRLLAPTGISIFGVDTGFWTDRLTPPARLAELAGGTAYEIVRLEQVAEQVATAVGADGFVTAYRERLAERSAHAIGFKSIAAYRVGLDLDPARPTDTEVTASVSNWLTRTPAGTAPRLDDATVIRFGIWSAIDLAKPVQFHVGFGDADTDMYRCDPLLLTPLLRATAPTGVPIMLLHNYPFHRRAGYLAQVFDHVFVDVGLTLHNVGTRADAVLAELLELAPFGSVLFSSDAFGLPELYTVGTAVFRRALHRFLDAGLADDAWSNADAERIARMIGRDNAARAYRLPA